MTKKLFILKVLTATICATIQTNQVYGNGRTKVRNLATRVLSANVGPQLRHFSSQVPAANVGPQLRHFTQEGLDAIKKEIDREWLRPEVQEAAVTLFLNIVQEKTLFNQMYQCNAPSCNHINNVCSENKKDYNDFNSIVLASKRQFGAILNSNNPETVICCMQDINNHAEYFFIRITKDVLENTDKETQSKCLNMMKDPQVKECYDDLVKKIAEQIRCRNAMTNCTDPNNPLPDQKATEQFEKSETERLEAEQKFTNSLDNKDYQYRNYFQNRSYIDAAIQYLEMAKNGRPTIVNFAFTPPTA